MVEAARRAGTVKRFFYSSSACIYPEYRQLETANPGLKESDAWPAQPQDAYGLEKLVTEEFCKYYNKVRYRAICLDPIPIHSTSLTNIFSDCHSVNEIKLTRDMCTGLWH